MKFKILLLLLLRCLTAAVPHRSVDTAACSGKLNVTLSENCCKPTNKCSENQGHCDSDADCQDGLRCGTTNCPENLGFLDEQNCCEKPDSLLDTDFLCKSLPLLRLCTVSDDCLTIVCRKTFMRQMIEIILRINKCDNPVSLSVRVKIPLRRIDIRRKLSEGLFSVPGFTITLSPITKAGLFIQASVIARGNILVFRVDLVAGIRMFYRYQYTELQNVLDLDLPNQKRNCDKSSRVPLTKYY